MNNQGFANRLKQAIAASGLPDTQSALAKTFGVSGVMVWSYRNGEKLPRMSTAIRIADALKVNVEWLLSGTGQMNAGSKPTPSPGISVENFTDGLQIQGRVPCISWIQAGAWGDVVDNFQPGDADLWIETTVPIRRHTYALKVQGDSMEPLFPAGSHIIVEPEMEWENGDYVVIRQNSNTECTFKQIIREGSQLYLKPLNPRYPIMEMRPDAIVCGVVRSMEQRFR